MVKKDPFQVSVDDQFQFEVQPEAAQQLDIVPDGEQAFHLLENGRAFHIKLLEADYANRRYTFQVDGIKHTVRISDYYERLVKKLGLTVGGTQKINSIKAPMPGLVLSVLVKPGQTVQKDDPLLILEAMKMENVIKADGEGVVKTIAVEKSQSVDKAQLLIEFE